MNWNEKEKEGRRCLKKKEMGMINGDGLFTCSLRCCAGSVAGYGSWSEGEEKKRRK